MKIFQNVYSLVPAQVAEGIIVRFVHGERVTLGVAELQPGSSLPRHQHENEQIGVVLRGSAAFDAGGETQTLTRGSVYSFPANVSHEVTAGPDGLVVAECFAPARADWDTLPVADKLSGVWPDRS
jgi:quercetin dioxygenase-like cupin family protein